jgi:hypothetical protein
MEPPEYDGREQPCWLCHRPTQDGDEECPDCQRAIAEMNGDEPSP